MLGSQRRWGLCYKRLSATCDEMIRSSEWSCAPDTLGSASSGSPILAKFSKIDIDLHAVWLDSHDRRDLIPARGEHFGEGFEKWYRMAHELLAGNT